tara:strand:+ start:70 stop:306 length:237 start_codon:yes stop_codon:yes gene_type:complete
MSKPETIKIVVSENKTSRMVIIKTPVMGQKNRRGEQYYTSVTKHESKLTKKQKEELERKKAEEKKTKLKDNKSTTGGK